MVLSIVSEFYTALMIETFSATLGETVHRTPSHPQGQFAMKCQRLKISVVHLANATPMSVERIRIVSRVEPGDVIRDATYVACRHPDEELPIGNHVIEWQAAV
jgi:hypothetical protein